MIDLQEDLLDRGGEVAILRDEICLCAEDRKSKNEAREALNKSGPASDTTQLHTGCEQIIEHLAKASHRAPIGHPQSGWHAALLKRMAESFPPCQPIHSQPSYLGRNRLRAFRHRERTNYGSELDGSIVLQPASEMASAAQDFKREIQAFLAA